MRTFIFALAVSVAALSQTGASGGCGGNPVITDPGFDLWCDDHLCAWHVDRGTIEKTSTWHGEDAGVNLIGDDVAISQLSQTQSSCIEFSFIANIDPQVEVRLEADVFGDNSVEYSERMPTARWIPLTYRMKFSRSPDGIRFRFSKRGAGTAVLAQLEAKAVSGCEASLAIAVGPAPLGASCRSNDQCVSSLCTIGTDFFPGVCTQCVGEPAPTQCQGLQVCGFADPESPIQSGYSQCVSPSSRELGERCRVDAECSSGICETGRCSTCNSGHPCRADEVCLSNHPHDPRQCSPGLNHRASGEPCFTNSDCASNACNGAEARQCPDGRACTITADCPRNDGAEHGACVPVGIQGGSCS
jgi:hypothetical protein